MSIIVPNSYSNEVKGDDAFHEDDDDNISLEGLDDDDDDNIFSTIPDASICIVRCHPNLDHGCSLNHVVLQICHKRPSYSKGGRSYHTCGLTCASILASASGATNALSHRTGRYGGGASRAGSNSFHVQNNLQSRVSPVITRLISDLATYRLARELKALLMECALVLEGQPKLLHLIGLRPPE
jgi:hypothetical protein